jgi:hypothetical protein
MNGEVRALSLGSLALILTALGIWAVMWGPGETDASDPAIAAGNLDGPVVRQSLPFDTGGDAALISGTLAVVEGCLVIVDSESSFPVVWPASTTWEATSQAVVLPNGSLIDLGGRVEGGGSYSDATRLDRFDDRARAHILTCPTNTWGEWALFNNNADAVRAG